MLTFWRRLASGGDHRSIPVGFGRQHGLIRVAPGHFHREVKAHRRDAAIEKIRRLRKNLRSTFHCCSTTGTERPAGPPCWDRPARGRSGLRGPTDLRLQPELEALRRLCALSHHPRFMLQGRPRLRLSARSKLRSGSAPVRCRPPSLTRRGEAQEEKPHKPLAAP